LTDSATWTEIEFRQEYLWSWGKYVCAVLRDEKLAAYRTPDAVAELVRRIKKFAGTADGLPTWDAAKIVDSNGNIIDHAGLDGIKRWIDWSTREAGLPLLNAGPSVHVKQPAVAEAGRAMGDAAQSMCVEAIEETIELSIGLPMKLAKIAAAVLAPEKVVRFETAVETHVRQFKSQFFKASYDYGPLLSNKSG
jgi:hypothetical protein